MLQKMLNSSTWSLGVELASPKTSHSLPFKLSRSTSLIVCWPLSKIFNGSLGPAWLSIGLPDAQCLFCLFSGQETAVHFFAFFACLNYASYRHVFIFMLIILCSALLPPSLSLSLLCWFHEDRESVWLHAFVHMLPKGVCVFRKRGTRVEERRRKSGKPTDCIYSVNSTSSSKCSLPSEAPTAVVEPWHHYVLL